jgi:signal peptidase II
MNRELKIATTIFIVVFIIDQVVKYGFANLSWDVDGPYMSLKIGIQLWSCFFYVFIFGT